METCCSCCTCVKRDAPRTRQVYNMLDNIEQYKRQQLEKLRENYAVQASIVLGFMVVVYVYVYSNIVFSTGA